MKKIISSLLAMALCLTLLAPTALAAAAWNGRVTVEWSNANLGFNNFRRERTYSPGVFSDVPAGAWYEEHLQALYEMGLIEGGSFRPGEGLTLRDVVSLAVRIHCTYQDWTVPAGQTDLEYALAVGIVAPGQYDNYDSPAARRSFAAIMANALPGEALSGINVVMDNIIPDVAVNDPGAQAIYLLYRAGVLLGGDSRGTFRPGEPITRAAAAVAAARMVAPSLRQGISLFSAQASGILLSQPTMTLSAGESGVLSARVVPDNSENREVTWSSSKPWIASVDSSGRVTGIAEGAAVITAATANGITASCAVGVDVAPLTFSGTGYYTDWLTVPDFGTLSRAVPVRVEQYDTYSRYYYALDSFTDADLMAFGDKIISAGFLLDESYDSDEGYPQLVFRKVGDDVRRQMVAYGREGDFLVVRPGRDA